MPKKTHGHTTKTTSSPTYKSWHAMLQRCNNERSPGYADYGGRGIKVCDEWLKFEPFLAAMGERPPGMTLDRIDNDAGYSPDNCRWATRRTQQRNRRNNHMLTYQGKTLCLQVWADKLDLKAHTLYYRIYKYNWSLEAALTTPPMQRGRRLSA